MKIGTVIRKYRKEKGYTQEELANRLGVTTPAVNKWENGVTLPDIAMLAPLARLLGISVDTLLSFREELTEPEIRDILNELWRYLNNGAFEEGVAYAAEQVRTYPACHGLMLWVAQALDAFFVVMPQYANEDTAAFVHGCYERALESTEEAIRISAADALFHSSMREENFEAAETFLQYFSMENPERKRKQALLYSKTGRLEEASRAYEELLYTGCQTARMVMQSLYNIAVQQGDMERAHYLVDNHSALVDVYDMGEYAKAAVVLDHALQTQNTALALDVLEQVLNTVESLNAFTTSPMYAHMQFNTMESGIEDRLRDTLKQAFREDPRMDFMKEDPRLVALIQ